MKRIEDHLGIGEILLHRETGRISIEPTMPEEKKGVLVMTNRRIMFFLEGPEGLRKVLDVTRRSVEGFRMTLEKGKALMEIRTPSVTARLSGITFERIAEELKSDFIAEGKALKPRITVEIDFTSGRENRYEIHFNDRLLGTVEVPPYFSTLFEDARFFSPSGNPVGALRHAPHMSRTEFLDPTGRVFGKIEYASPRSMVLYGNGGKILALGTSTTKDNEYEVLFIDQMKHVPVGSVIMPFDRSGKITGVDLKIYEFREDPKYLIFAALGIKRYLEEIRK